MAANSSVGLTPPGVFGERAAYLLATAERRVDHFIVNEQDVEWAAVGCGEAFQSRRKQLAAAAGGELIGCSLYETPPGKTAFPRHMHFGNEEAFYVLAGRGTLRLGDESFEVEPEHWVALRANEGRAHQMRNEGDEPLRYLCLSTMVAPDIGYYPDSDKIGVFGGTAPGGDLALRSLGAYLPGAAAVPYWTGEVAEEQGVVESPRIEPGAKPDRWPPIAGPVDAMVREVTMGRRCHVRGETLGRVAGSNRLGCTRFRCFAGHTSFPRHAHLRNEEAIFVLSGTGVSVMGEEERAIRPGDYIVYPPEAELAHTIRADAGRDLEYLCFSTNEMPEVVFYPDSDKVQIMGKGQRLILDRSAELGYWDREPEQ